MSAEQREDELEEAEIVDGDEDTDVEIEVVDQRPPTRFWAHVLSRYLPFLFTDCPFGNKHWRWDRLCVCGFGQPFDPDQPSGWHGGVFDLRQDTELLPCAHCYPEHSPHSHQWSLTDEEEHILQAWRMYREDVLSNYGKQDPFRYEISVDLNGMKTFLMSRTQGLSTVSGARGLFAGSQRGGHGEKPN